jgi:hypothetical protein
MQSGITQPWRTILHWLATIAVPRSNLIGPVILTFWPPSRIALP